MDDLYANLENYQDENIIDELKNENKDLKIKLEEYSSATIRLQNNILQDFDKLNSEYKKLELNYSSLLKTARAEIERKSEMIKSLNSEKDLLIIKTLQSSGKNYLKTRRRMLDAQRSNKSEINSESTGKPQSEPQLTAGNQNEGNRKQLDRIEPIFSSDDDFEALNLKNIRKSPLKEDIRYNEKFSNRDNCYRSSKYCNDRTNRFTDHNRHNKYESGSKYTRHSPEKHRTKNVKEHSQTNNLRNDYKNGRPRVLRSPPMDKYNRSKSRDRRPFDRENYYEKQRHSPHNYEYSTVKHKIRNDHEEPSSKRHKTELFKKSTIDEHIYNNDIEKEFYFRSSFTKHQDISEPTTCQSPDYVNNECTTLQHIAKEIKHTALSPLEDPRVSSKIYAIKSKEKVSAVDIKPINVTKWNIPNKEKFIINTKQLPEPLTKYVDEIYMDIENPLLNDSLESGEVQSLIDYDIRYTKESDVSGKCENKEINKYKEQSEKIHDTCVIDYNKTKSPAINKYKIPKVKKPDKISSCVKHDSLAPPINKNISAGNYCNETKEDSEIKENCKISEVQTSINEQTQTNFTNGTLTLKQYKPNEIIKATCGAVLPVKTSVAVGTLADDLELSDEASESTDLKKDVKESKTLTNDKTAMDIPQDENNLPLIKNQNRESKEKGKHLRSKKGSKDSRDGCKTRKSKKKIDQKEPSCTEGEELKIVMKVKDKQSKPVISIQTKSKFSDLFGDSSSLITPDDLGIPPTEIHLPLADKYASMFDNTQDAVDLNVVHIKKTQSGNNNLQNDLSNEKTITGKADIDDTLVSKDVDKSATVSNLRGDSLRDNPTMNDVSKLIKTVIISTGVQPKCTTSDNIKSQDNQQDSERKCIEHTQDINIDKLKIPTSLLNNIKALATSTPHKPQLEDGATAIPDANVENNSMISDTTHLSTNVCNSSNPEETVNETDIPDVRIFVRRRRKIIKRP
ncbi:uncharacterized protein LOC120625772 isoform X4 [Pararge aegeria]|uniref:uncharacterized protein LOC120625772 isoform X4 n=1 Tax=Pararge aegeria TaxID=116150 RepID=UPI0019CF5921|nr:uncharacterized protein LOC120625772 isoform X4 [Pararge aegeria]